MTKQKTDKPAKPYPDFPLFPHATKRWAKKIRGQMCYFGPWSDPDAALAKYLRERDILQAGQTPPKAGEDRKTLVDLVNDFMDTKEARVKMGKMTQRQLLDYQRSCKRVVSIMGRTTIVEALKPKDFDRLAVKLAEGVSKVTFANRIRLARALFLHASKYELIEKRLNFGELFKIPDKMEIRVEQQKTGARDFTADELRKIIEAASIPLKAMILLGINCGLGNNDLATLPRSAVNLDTRWIDYPRQKTAVERRCPLWPETVAALRLSLAKRPMPKDESHADLCFVTKYGQPYVRLSEAGSNLDAIAGEFAKILSALKLSGRRRAFYSLRRTFETVGGGCLDQVAVDLIMGHAAASSDMAATYRQRIDDSRLVAVSEHVRKWLALPEKTTSESSAE